MVGYHRGEAKSCFVVLHYIGGELAAKDWELLTVPMEDEQTTVSTLAAQYYGPMECLYWLWSISARQYPSHTPM